jgi:hypothetical protein
MDTGGEAQQFTLELACDPQMVHGILEHENGTREPFWGWLELMAALERAAAVPPQRRDETLQPRDEEERTR